MEFHKINLETWKRKEYFEHYFSHVPCTYSITVKLDITALLNQKTKLYPAMLYAITTVVNKHEEFRTAFNEREELGVYSQMIPCYRVFHKDSETFSNIWTEYDPDYAKFFANYEKDQKEYRCLEGMSPKPNLPDNNFPVSMVPWTGFEGFNLNLEKGYGYLLPIFTMGRYYKDEKRWWLPLAVQVHHGVCDGFHVSRFINELQELIKEEKRFEH